MHEEKQEKGNFDLKVWKKMLPFIKPYYKTLAVVFALMVFLAAVDISIPLFLRAAVDSFVVAQTVTGLLPFGAVYLLVLVLQAVGVVLMARGAMNIEMNLGRDLKHAAFKHLQTLGFSYYNQNAVGWVLARVMSDTNRLSGVVAWSAT
ncbi:MAG: ABC transporter transmembrane domain-containing protein, partial [Oscillospiraceae bacterium]